VVATRDKGVFDEFANLALELEARGKRNWSPKSDSPVASQPTTTNAEPMNDAGEVYRWDHTFRTSF